MPIEFYFTPELHLRDGRIRDLDDAISFAREEPSVQGCANKETIKFFQSLRLGRRYGEYCRYYLGRRMPEEGGMTPPAHCRGRWRSPRVTARADRGTLSSPDVAWNGH
jgi:hypothetical protein